MKKNITIALLFVALPICYAIGFLSGVNKVNDDDIYVNATKASVKNVISHIYEYAGVNRTLPDSFPSNYVSSFGAKVEYIKSKDGKTFDVNIISVKPDMFSKILGVNGKYEKIDQLTKLNDLYFDDINLEVVNE